jgi:hypothetical protein
MFVWLRGQGFESSVNKVLQKEKLVNSKTKRFTVLKKELVQQELTWFNLSFLLKECPNYLFSAAQHDHL